DKYAGYNTSIAVNEDDDMDDADGEDQSRRLVGQYTATTEQMNEYAHGEADILVDREKQAQIASRESDYQKRRFNRQLSPDGQSYKEVMKQRELEREEERVHKLIEEKQAKGEDGMDGVVEHQPTLKADEESSEVAAPRKRKQRWDTSSEDAAAKDAVVKSEGAPETKRSRWDSTPAPAAQAEPRKRSRFDMAPSLTAATPVGGNAGLATPMHPSQAPAVGAGYGSDISARN
ncbi:ARM repeat-containing protein, partial [Aureobasidium melanogenum]